MSVLELQLACGERLSVHEFSVSEAVSALFTVKVLARSPDPSIDLRAILGQPAALRILSGTRFAFSGERAWSGVCSHVRLVHAVPLGPAEVGLSTYGIAIAPRLWLLSQRTNHRIFRHMSNADIARRLLEEWRIDDVVWRINGADHPRLSYRVQYAETDLDFLSRLLEEAGIAYMFDDDGERSRLVLSDALHLSAPRREVAIPYVDNPSEAAEREFVTRVAVDETIRPDAVTIRDYDFQRPAFALLGEAQGPATAASGCLEHYRYRPGGFLIESQGAPCHDMGHGGILALIALDAERTGGSLVSFETNAIDLRPGTIVTVEGHPRPELDPTRGLLVTSLAIDGSPNGEWTTRGMAVSAAEPYRPPLRTPKPKVYGIQSAVVVGPPGQEIHTDEHGRVRVQFPWDREGKLDEESSCWLRVSQGWAGAGFGLFALPRVGQEVLVAFLEGDPDQPIVVGRTANALNPLPVRLPNDRTQSAWRSSSSPGGEGFNEIRFEDRKGAELLSVRAERDMRAFIRQDEAIAIGRHRTVTVGGDASARTEGRLVMYLGQDAHVTIEAELRERIGGTRSLTVEGDQHHRVAGAAAFEAGGAIHIRAGGALVLEGADVTLRGPGGFVRIDGGGVTIDGGAVNIQKGGAPGEGQGAHPALPVVPLRVDQDRAPGRRRLPLIALPGLGPPQPPRPSTGGPRKPLTPEEATVCGFICQCNADPFPHKRPSDCLTARIRALDAASGGMSRIKAEVPYDMSKDPPEPVMSRKEPERPSRGKHPKGSRAPDVVIVKDPSKPPTQDNLEEVIEVKFPGDNFREGQERDYTIIAGPAPLEKFDPERCGCPDRKRKQEQEQEQKVTAQDLAEVALLTLLVIVLIVDDVAPGGQLDDAAIPAAIARILDRLAPLLRGPAPVIP